MTVRTSGALTPKQGPLQLYYNSSWHVVCDTDFDDVDARVVCREMGYIDGKSICCSAYGQQLGAQKADDNSLDWYSLNCDGNEASLLECKMQTGCQSRLYVSVICRDKDDFYDESKLIFFYINVFIVYRYFLLY